MDREMILEYMRNRKQECTLEIMDVETGERKTLAHFDRVIEAPNWTMDNKALIYNSEGLIYRFDLTSRTSTVIETGFANLCNNDHVLSSDGKSIAISHFAMEDMKSKIYVVPIEGGEPNCITKVGHSFLHGWSPDGSLLAYCAERNGDYNIHTIGIDGEKETQLTFTEGLDDGPEFDPTGTKIWFNSTRSGLMQVWAMHIDGTEQEQISHIDMNCWFPHVSPDKEKVVYIAYFVGDLKPEEHLPDKKVQIRMMDIEGNNDHVLAEFMGGQGSMNVNSWSPDSRYIAFVSY